MAGCCCYRRGPQVRPGDQEQESEIIGRFAEYLQDRGRLTATVESYCRDARSFLAYMRQVGQDPYSAIADNLVAFQSHLVTEKGERASSVRRTVVGVRQFYRFLESHGVLSGTPFEAVPIPGQSLAKLPTLTAADIDLVLAEASQQGSKLKALRDVAMVHLLAFEGLKISELVELSWSDWVDRVRDERVGELVIRGLRARNLRVSPETAEALRAYQKALQGDVSSEVEVIPCDGQAARMFVGFRGRDGAMPLGHVTRHGLKFALYEIASKCDLGHLNAEKLRHFAVSHLIAQGRSNEEIMMHLGLRRPGNVERHARRADLDRSTEGVS